MQQTKFINFTKKNNTVLEFDINLYSFTVVNKLHSIFSTPTQHNIGEGKKGDLIVSLLLIIHWFSSVFALSKS